MAQLVNKRTLNAWDLQAIGQLLVEILGGEVTAGLPLNACGKIPKVQGNPPITIITTPKIRRQPLHRSS